MIKLVIKNFNELLPINSKFPLNYMIPVYHTVSDEYLPHVRNIIRYKNSRDFEKDLDYIHKNFDFADWDFFKENYNVKAKKPCALLTFDDGLIEFKEVVMPILLRKGIYAINFINPPFIGNADIMFRMKASLLIEKIKKRNTIIPRTVHNLLRSKYYSESDAINKIRKINYNNKYILTQVSQLLEYDFQEYLNTHKVYMDLNDLNSAKKSGFGIGAHSWDHPFFYDLSLSKQMENAQKSIDYVRDNGFLSEGFAFPFSDMGVSKMFFEKLFENNRELKFTFGTSGIKLDSISNNLHRIAMESGSTAEKEVNFESNYFRIKNLLNKNKIIRL